MNVHIAEPLQFPERSRKNCAMDQLRSNFEFLDCLDRELANLGRLAESYFQDDPSTSLIRLRQFGERLTRRHAALVGSDVQDTETQIDVLRRLQYERSMPDRVLDVLHHIFGPDPLGGSDREEQGEDSRWRKLTPKQIAERGDNFDWTWLRDESSDPVDDMTEPDEIAAAIMVHLRAALDEIEALSEELDDTPAVEAAE